MKIETEQTFTFTLTREEFKILASAMGSIQYAPEFCEQIYERAKQEFKNDETLFNCITGYLTYVKE